MATDFHVVCYDCKDIGPIFASSSIAYGYKVWDIEDLRIWLGHREDCGKHECHDLRIVMLDALPWDNEDYPIQDPSV